MPFFSFSFLGFLGFLAAFFLSFSSSSWFAIISSVTWQDTQSKHHDSMKPDQDEGCFSCPEEVFVLVSACSLPALLISTAASLWLDSSLRQQSDLREQMRGSLDISEPSSLLPPTLLPIQSHSRPQGSREREGGHGFLSVSAAARVPAHPHLFPGGAEDTQSSLPELHMTVALALTLLSHKGSHISSQGWFLSPVFSTVPKPYLCSPNFKYFLRSTGLTSD